MVPVYDVARYLPACLDSLLAQTHPHLEIIVVDDGSPDDSGAIADAYAARDDRIRVVHIENRGLGGARNEGLRHVHGDWVAFADSDDVVPPASYETLLRHAERDGADVVTGDVARLVGDDLVPVPWTQRLHRDCGAVAITEHPELLGDVFAWNKLFRREFWTSRALSWPERIRYEDQPTTTEAFVAAERITMVPEIVYHWRERHDASSITQQRATVADLVDRWATKRMALATVESLGSPEVSRVFRNRVLPGDLHNYFRLIPACTDEWWELLVGGVREFWAPPHSLTQSTLLPAYRLAGWLVEHDRRADAATVIRFRAGHEGRLPRVRLPDGGERIDVPGLDMASIALEAVRLP